MNRFSRFTTRLLSKTPYENSGLRQMNVNFVSACGFLGKDPGTKKNPSRL
jgi:hypothetical protein